MSEKFLLAGDIGGTKTNLALFSNQKGTRAPVLEKRIVSSDIKDLCITVKNFLQENNVKPDACCLGVAGPVFNGKAKITKLGWHLTEENLQKELGIPSVILVNDLAATAYALPILEKSDECVINKGRQDPHGAKVIIAPGTGLGEVFLTWGHDNYLVHSSEGGHCLFAPENKLQRELLDFLSDTYEQVTYDLICSGVGIPLIYSFLKNKKSIVEPHWLADKLHQSIDATPYIIESAVNLEQQAQISVQTLEIFLEILASESANCAVKILSTGGVYLAGGIPPRILELFKTKTFFDIFTSRKPFQTFLSEIPFKIITNPKAALMGAACHGMKRMGNE